VLGEIEHLLVNITSWMSSKILVLVSDLVRVAQQDPDQSPAPASGAMMCSRLVSTTRAMATLSMLRMV
jgi:hypothetical protein